MLSGLSVLPIFRNKKGCKLTYSSDVAVCFELIWCPAILSLPLCSFSVAVLVQWELVALFLFGFG